MVLAQDVEPFIQDTCPFCSFASLHYFFPHSVTRNKAGRILSLTVMCGWSGCGAMREERL